MNTEQFWQGEFGDKYTERNVDLVENNYQMFDKMFNSCHCMGCHIDDINSIIEFGAGSGMNIQALKRIFPSALFGAVEINKQAIQELLKIPNLSVSERSILDQELFNFDLVLTKGLLIHIHPDDIQKAYEVLYNASNKYILICEYYSPNRIMIPYRGEDDKLWKADFAGEMLDKYSDLSLIDYGFCYNRISKNNNFTQDSITWFLLKK